jgi:hypothetical protein
MKNPVLYTALFIVLLCVAPLTAKEANSSVTTYLEPYKFLWENNPVLQYVGYAGTFIGTMVAVRTMYGYSLKYDLKVTQLITSLVLAVLSAGISIAISTHDKASVIALRSWAAFFGFLLAGLSFDMEFSRLR